MASRSENAGDDTQIIWKQIPLTSTDEIVLFVTYNDHNIVPEHTRDYLRCLKTHGFKIILIRVLKDFKKLPEDSVDFVDATVLRANRGYDFGAWAHILRLYPEVWKTKLVIIANDSIYGPLDEQQFKKIIDRIRCSDADYIGLTDTNSTQYHFQSYFTALKPSARATPAFQAFWNDVRYLSDKFDIIDAYEITAVAYYQSRGLKCQALFPVSEWGLKYSYNEYNPTIQWWRQIRERGFPFLKVELLRDFLSIQDWEPSLEGSGYDAGKIHRHLKSYPGYVPIKIKTDKPSNILKDIERMVRKPIKALKPSALLPAITIPLSWVQKNSSFKSSSPIAVVIHAYYIDVMEEILCCIGHIPFSFHLYISVDTKEKAKELSNLLQNKFSFEIRLSPNRGRDIAPKFITFSDVYRQHEYFLHLHTKKTIYNQNFGQYWRTNLLQTLAGSEEIVRSNLEILSRKDIGIVYPRYFSRFPLASRWSGNFVNTRILLQEMGISIDRDRYFDFPAGSMFWGKSNAILPLLDLKLSFDDFPPEQGQPDGTLAHAIERSILSVAAKQGYLGQQVVLNNFKLPGYKFIQVRNESDLEEAVESSRRIIGRMERGLIKRIL